MISGIKERIEKELTKLSPTTTTKINIITPTERKYLTWFGGSNLGLLFPYNPIWITKDEVRQNFKYVYSNLIAIFEEYRISVKFVRLS